MQPQRGSRIDLGELKAQIVKKTGSEKSKRYFYYLTRFLSQKLSKNEFDRSCYHVLGRENLPLHNQLIRAILKNACLGTSPPLIHEVGPTKSWTQTAKVCLSRDVPEQIGSLVPNQNLAIPLWSNGCLPVSPRKVRSGVRDRKLRDRPSPLGPNGKVENGFNPLACLEENGGLTPYDYQRPIQHLQSVAERPEIENLKSRDKGHSGRAVAEDGDEVENFNYSSFSRPPLFAPLGIPLCSASVGGARKTVPALTTPGLVTYYDCGGLSDTETLRKRMEQIAVAQNLEGVSLECANVLNNILDIYLKKLIRSCIELVGSRAVHEPKRLPLNKQQAQDKHVNGIWPNSRLHMHNCSGCIEVMQEERPVCSISLLDFKFAMELNPQQLGEDWPLLLEKICMNLFEG